MTGTASTAPGRPPGLALGRGKRPGLSRVSAGLRTRRCRAQPERAGLGGVADLCRRDDVRAVADGRPAYVRGDLQAVLLGEGEARVAARFGRAAVPAPAQRELVLPRRLRDLFADGEGGGLAEHTARACQPVGTVTGSAPTQLSEATRATARMLDYLFRSELRLTLQEGVLHVRSKRPPSDPAIAELPSRGVDGTRRSVVLPPSANADWRRSHADPDSLAELAETKACVVLYRVAIAPTSPC